MVRPTLERFLVLVLLLGGCNSAKVLAIEHSPSFSPASLTKEGVVVGGITSSEPARLAREASPDEIASSLAVAMLENRPQMKVLAPSSVEYALGQEAYRSLLTYFEKTGELKSEQVSAILPKLHERVRFLVVARIESDEVSTSESQDSRYETDSKTGKADWVDYGTKYTTSRTTAMRFALYDMETGSLEWRAHLKTSNDHTRTVGTPGSVSLLEFVLEVLDEKGDQSASMYPAPVSIQEQTHRLRDEFLDTLFDEK
jgi:hypothetical protein